MKDLNLIKGANNATNGKIYQQKIYSIYGTCYMHETLLEICYLHGTPIEIYILKPSFKRLMYGYTRGNVCRKLRLRNHAISKKGYGCKLT